MTIWSADNHIRHPWFDAQVKKRKHSRESPCSSEESDVSEPPARKRQRCSVLEQGFAHLSLSHKSSRDDEVFVEPCVPIVTEVTPDECAMDADDEGDSIGPPAVLPRHVEEPEQDIPEVQMKTSSWYELSPDRIVITDLDSFESEDEPADESRTLEINPHLLKRIKKQTPLALPEATSQALVLFRPLPNVGPLKGPEEAKKLPLVADAEPMEVES
ncbi:hypothetical protein NP233_g7963 [Leucocoprinus birnbaumii]|uniref:Uncharacterized protein n=1 Tax=Leucocoprinus birnbaumii TaxID=56174 RepID=A0AAD5VNW3_9AGAR|nr:hypothetical protein NP233_g7963 [Leucocoprinus birnbaumii]